MSNPRANYLFFMLGQSCVAATQFGNSMGFPIPDHMMEKMIVHSINEFLKRTKQPELTEEEKGYYRQGMKWMSMYDTEKILKELITEEKDEN